MTIPTFTPPRPPKLGSKKSVKYRTKEAGFGDNYVQVAADGINTKDVSWDLSWTLSQNDCDTIEAFCDSVAGYLPFYYTVSGDIQRKYKCKGFSRVQAEGEADAIVMTIMQVYDP